MEKKYDDKEVKGENKKESNLLKNIKDIIFEGNEHEPGCVYIKLFIYIVCFYFLTLFFYHIIFK